MPEIITAKEAADLVPDGASVMFGGFMGCGNPHSIVDALLEKGVRDITLIANDAASPEVGIGRLVVAGRVKKLIATHVGTNRHVGARMNDGTLEAELIPQGTMAERIRAAGAGLGGFLTPAGVSTPVEEGKRKMTVNGREYLLELPLRADIALINAWKGDERGNLIYRLSARNFNPLMAMAATLVIAEVGEIVPAGALDPDAVHPPGVFVHKLVRTGRQTHGR